MMKLVPPSFFWLPFAPPRGGSRLKPTPPDRVRLAPRRRAPEQRRRRDVGRERRVPARPQGREPGRDTWACAAERQRDCGGVGSHARARHRWQGLRLGHRWRCDWERAEYDQCEGPALVESLADKVIAHIATGYDFSVAVTADGNLYCTGDNSMGQCPVGRGGVMAFAPVPIPELSGKVVAVAAGSFHTLALLRDGTVYAFGRGRDGQLGNGRVVNGQRPCPT